MDYHLTFRSLLVAVAARFVQEYRSGYLGALVPALQTQRQRRWRRSTRGRSIPVWTEGISAQFLL
jgi:hypothetical protein